MKRLVKHILTHPLERRSLMKSLINLNVFRVFYFVPLNPFFLEFTFNNSSVVPRPWQNTQFPCLANNWSLKRSASHSSDYKSSFLESTFLSKVAFLSLWTIEKREKNRVLARTKVSRKSENETSLCRGCCHWLALVLVVKLKRNGE